MKKENYGIPATLLCVAIYLTGLYGAVNTSLWPIVGLTIVVFALSFNSDVKKTALQALGIVLVFCAAYIVVHVLGIFNDLIKSFADSGSDGIRDYFTGTYSSSYGSNGFDSFLYVIGQLLNIAAYVLFSILGICAMTGKPLFVGKVHMVVDGFIPVKPMPQQMYGGQQSYNQPQPQQFTQQQPQQQPQSGMYNPMGMQQPRNAQPQNPQSQQMYQRHPQQTYNSPVQQPEKDSADKSVK